MWEKILEWWGSVFPMSEVRICSVKLTFKTAWKWGMWHQRAEQEAWNDVRYVSSAYEIGWGVFFLFLRSRFVIQHFLPLTEYKKGENCVEKEKFLLFYSKSNKILAIKYFCSLLLRWGVSFPQITFPSTSWSENPGTVEKVVFRLSLDASSTYNRCEVPPALLALDTWGMAVLTLDKWQQDRPVAWKLWGASAGWVFNSGRAAQGPPQG